MDRVHLRDREPTEAAVAVRRLGSGSSAIAFVVNHGGREVVLKLPSGPEHDDRVRGEAEVLRQIRHQNVGRVAGDAQRPDHVRQGESIAPFRRACVEEVTSMVQTRPLNEITGLRCSGFPAPNRPPIAVESRHRAVFFRWAAGRFLSRRGNSQQARIHWGESTAKIPLNSADCSAHRETAPILETDLRASVP